MGTATKQHPVPDRVKSSCNFWHLGTLTLKAERQSAQMSKITNDGLTRSGTGCCFVAVPIWQQWVSKGWMNDDNRNCHIVSLAYNSDDDDSLPPGNWQALWSRLAHLLPLVDPKPYAPSIVSDFVSVSDSLVANGVAENHAIWHSVAATKGIKLDLTYETIIIIYWYFWRVPSELHCCPAASRQQDCKVSGTWNRVVRGSNFYDPTRPDPT